MQLLAQLGDAMYNRVVRLTRRAQRGYQALIGSQSAALALATHWWSTRLSDLFVFAGDFLRDVFILLVITCVVVYLLVLFVFGCLLLATISVGVLRHFTLVNVAGNRLLSIPFNTAPLYTEWWKSKPIDDTIHRYLPSHRSAAAIDDVHSDQVVTLSPGLIETHAKDLKLALLQQYTQNMVATATLLLPIDSTQDVFLPDGGVNLHAIFSAGAPLFNSWGEYAAAAQLVFLREEASRDVSITVEAAMLFAEDARVPQSLGSLDVLFRTVHSAQLRSGVHPVWWPVALLYKALRLCFFVPVKSYEVAHHYIRQSASVPFNAIDPEREVGVVIDVYKHFTPPLTLQPRLRAINFTIYQQSEDATTGPPRRLKLTRLALFSSVRLHGLARFFTRSPIISFTLFTVAFFALYMTAAIVTLATIGGFVSMHFWQQRGAHAEMTRHPRGGSEGANTLPQMSAVDVMAQSLLPGDSGVDGDDDAIETALTGSDTPSLTGSSLATPPVHLSSPDVIATGIEEGVKKKQ